MGKSNRIKEEKATSALAAPAKKKSAKKGMPTWVGTAIVIAVLAIAVIVVTLSVLSSRGTFKRMHVIAETENFQVTVPMMSYMLYTEYKRPVKEFFWTLMLNHFNIRQDHLMHTEYQDNQFGKYPRFREYSVTDPSYCGN